MYMAGRKQTWRADLPSNLYNAKPIRLRRCIDTKIVKSILPGRYHLICLEDFIYKIRNVLELCSRDQLTRGGGNPGGTGAALIAGSVENLGSG